MTAEALRLDHSRKSFSLRERLGWRSLRSAFASIWRIRSRVTLNSLPTSSSVRARPKRSWRTRRSRPVSDCQRVEHGRDLVSSSASPGPTPATGRVPAIDLMNGRHCARLSMGDSPNDRDSSAPRTAVNAIWRRLRSLVAAPRAPTKRAARASCARPCSAPPTVS